MNVLFLIVDEMSWWALGHERPFVQTPNIDALAAGGTRFTAAYTPSPMCVPARAAMAAGRYVHEIGNWSSAEPYDGAVPSWGHAVQAAGADCVSVGKLHYRDAQADTGFAQQFEPLHVPGNGWERGLLRKPLCDYAPTAELAQMIGAGDTGYHDFDRAVTNAACTWLADPARRARPWAAMVSWLSPHYPLIAPAAYFARYDPADFTGPPEAAPDHPILNQMRAFFDHDPYFSNDARGTAIAAYYALCTFIDAQIGMVLRALDTAGLREDTLIIFSSDHGEMLGEKGFWTKQVMYDSSARVPLILSGPGVAPGVRYDPVSLIDIAPTICAALGAQGDFTGRDLRAPVPQDRTVLSEYHDGGSPVGVTLVRWNDGAAHWKYVHYAEGHPPQLFELHNDPQELHDLSSDHPDVCAEALRRLCEICDPEAVNARAHADQSLVIERLGGRQTVLDRPQWNFTPAERGLSRPHRPRAGAEL